MKKNCPKCGFYMMSSNCPKCGYERGTIYQEKYQTQTNDLELLLKDEYQKIIHNQNNHLILILGSLYFAYYNFYFLSFIFTSLELFIYYIIISFLNSIDTVSNIALTPLFIFGFILLRIIYLSFFNTLLLSLLKNKLTKIKEKENYQEYIYKYQPKSILRPTLVILSYILIIIIIAVIYRIIRGNI